MISIALTTFNGEKYIERQLESICNQELKPDEIVISDDNSSDDTLNIITLFKNKYKNINWNIIKNKTRIGFALNFRNAINNTKGDIIFLSDQDDEWDTNKLSSMTKVILNNDNMKLLYSTYRCIDKNEKLILDKFVYCHSLLLSFKLLLKKYVNISTELFMKTRNVPGMVMCFKRELIVELNKISDENLYCHDSILAVIASINDGLFYYDKPLISYRLHDNNAIGINSIRENTKVDRMFWIKSKINGAKMMLSACKEICNDRIYKAAFNELELSKYRLSCYEKRRIPNIFRLNKYNSLLAFLGDIKYIICKND